MSSKKKRRGYSQYHQQNLLVLQALQAQANEKCSALGHMMGVWAPAKKKFGQSAMKSLCVNCGTQVVLVPRHWHSIEHQQVPALTGEALFVPCMVESE